MQQKQKTTGEGTAQQQNLTDDERVFLTRCSLIRGNEARGLLFDLADRAVTELNLQTACAGEQQPL